MGNEATEKCMLVGEHDLSSVSENKCESSNIKLAVSKLFRHAIDF